MLEILNESLFPAMYGTTVIEDISALGILETYDAASIIEEADQAAKTAIVDVDRASYCKGYVRKILYDDYRRGIRAVEASIQRAKSLLPKKACTLTLL